MNNYPNSNERNENTNDDQFVCLEIAGAESIPGLNYKPQKATQDSESN